MNAQIVVSTGCVVVWFVMLLGVWDCIPNRLSAVVQVVWLVWVLVGTWILLTWCWWGVGVWCLRTV